MSNKLIVSIVIVNYKVKQKLFDCLRSIYKSKPHIKFEIIIVDNDQKDTLRRELAKKFPKVVYVKSENNLGYGAGNNLGANKAKGKYLFFLNPDTTFFNNAIDILVKFVTKKNKVGIVAPLLLDKNNNPYELQGTLELTPLRGIIVFSFLHKIFSHIFNRYWITSWNKNEIKNVYSIPGTAFLIKKSLFDNIGKFDEKFFLYFEEFDICKRVKDQGYEIFIIPKAKVFHEWGASTKNEININKIFIHSRYLYFKKHFGLIKSLLVEILLRADKSFFLVLFFLFLAFFLRMYNLYKGMSFIGDQGWFYLSARDLLIYRKIPLVGITSSHIWLHQGPLWTYMLSFFLFIFSFNPLSGGYLTIIFGVVSTFLLYKLGSSLFSTKVGLISAALFAVSPLVILFDRMPFDPSPIPFFTLLYFYSLCKWIQGGKKYFPLVIFFLAVLYNLELATFTLFFPFAFIFFFGFVKKKKWVLNILNKKTFILSFIGFVAPMLPILIYDFFNGFKQTIIFFVWTIYKPFSSLLVHSSPNLSYKGNEMIPFLYNNLQKLIFGPNLFIAILIFLSSVIYLFFYVKKIRFKLENSKTLLFLILCIVLLGIIINQTPSGAYLPIIFPFAFISLGILFDYLLSIRKLKHTFLLILFLLLLGNSYSAYKNDLGNQFRARIDAVNKVIVLTKNQEYNLIGIGIGSQFSTFTSNYEYLLWWKGHAPSKKITRLKIYVSENSNKITVTRKYD